MAREDLLAQLLRQLTQKEDPPPPDDNTLIQKMIAPNETMQVAEGQVTLATQTVANMKWGGNQYCLGLMGVVPTAYLQPGWKWGQGQWK